MFEADWKVISILIYQNSISCQNIQIRHLHNKSLPLQGATIDSLVFQYKNLCCLTLSCGS